MRSNTVWWIIFWLINLSVSITAQNTRQVIALADQLSAEGHYHTALDLYRRAYFFGSPSERFYSALLIARNELPTGNTGASTAHYDLAILNAPDDSTRREIQLEKTTVLLLAQNPQEAYIELLSIQEAPNDSLWQRRLTYYLGTVFIALGQWDDAADHFMQLMPDRESELRLQQIFQHHRHKKPRTAKRLSYILPGAGHAYTGNWKTALNSLLLTGGIAAVGITTGLDYGWGSSIWTLNWFARYYRGGAQNAAKAAQRVNRKRDHQLLEQINQLIFPQNTTSNKK